MSRYDPALGGVNCANFVDGKCISNMANGEGWEQYMNTGIVACPPEYPFGTIFVIEEVSYICKDRGGAIQVDDGLIWLDVLTNNPIYYYGEVVEGFIIFP